MARLQQRSLSNRVVDGLPIGERDVIYWDRGQPGFGVRVYPNGTRVYLVQGRGPGGSKRITVGRHGMISADEARRQGAARLTRIKAGEEPESGADAEGGPTVADLAERYLREHVAVRCKENTQKGYRQVIGRHVLPALGKMPIAALGREHVAELQYRLRKTPIAANDAVGALSRMLNRAEAWGLVPAGSNPCRFVTRYRTRRPGAVSDGGRVPGPGRGARRGGGRGTDPGSCGGGSPSFDADRVSVRGGAGSAVGGRGAGAERGRLARQQDGPSGGSAVACGGAGPYGPPPDRGQSVGDRGPRTRLAADAHCLLLVPCQGAGGTRRRTASRPEAQLRLAGPWPWAKT